MAFRDPDIGFYMVPLETKAVVEDEEGWTFTGYAAVFNNVDQGGDVILPGAFKKCLREGLPDLHVEHKYKEEPVGTITDAYEDDFGLKVEGFLDKRVPKAVETYAHLKPRGTKGMRAYRGMSIGYHAVDSARDRRDGKSIRLLKELNCIEASFVRRPMNKLAVLTSLKSEDDGLTALEWKDMTNREREAALVARGISERLAKRFIATERDAFDASQRDAGDVVGRVDVPDFAALIRQTAQRL